MSDKTQVNSLLEAGLVGALLQLLAPRDSVRANESVSNSLYGSSSSSSYNNNKNNNNNNIYNSNNGDVEFFIPAAQRMQVLRTLNALPVKARHLTKQNLKMLSKHGAYVNRRDGDEILHKGVAKIGARLLGYYTKLDRSHKKDKKDKKDRKD